MTLRYDTAEYQAIQVAASRARMTPTGYVAEVALAAASGFDPPDVQQHSAALVELMLARTQVRRFAVNVNQAVRELNATGRAPEWLERAVYLTARAVDRLDEAALAVARQATSPTARRRRPGSHP